MQQACGYGDPLLCPAASASARERRGVLIQSRGFASAPTGVGGLIGFPARTRTCRLRDPAARTARSPIYGSQNNRSIKNVFGRSGPVGSPVIEYVYHGFRPHLHNS
jgi:hypothetical protein